MNSRLRARGDLVNHVFFNAPLMKISKSVLVLDNDTFYDKQNECFEWSYFVIDSDGKTFWIDEDETEDLDEI